MSTLKINAGHLTKRISILTPTGVKDVVGAPRNEFELLSEVSAKVDYKTAKELEKNTRPTGFTKVIFTVALRSDVSKDKKIVYKNKVFNILTVLPILKPRKLFMQVVTEQVETSTGTIAAGTPFVDKSENVWITQDGQVIMWN